MGLPFWEIKKFEKRQPFGENAKRRPLHHGGTARRSRNQRQDLCTTEALRHGETQKIDELLWHSGTLGLFQGAVSLFQTSSHQQKAEDTEVLNLPLLACIRPVTRICAKKQEFRAW